MHLISTFAAGYAPTGLVEVFRSFRTEVRACIAMGCLERRSYLLTTVHAHGVPISELSS